MTQTKKTILITGVSKGIGKGLSIRLLELGYHVIGTVRKLGAADNFGEVVELDLTNESSIKSLSEQLNRESRRIDILINNAGIGSDHYDDLSKKENFELRFETHLFGPYYFTESILPLINKGGKIINISSKLSSFEEVGKIDVEKLTATKMAYIISKASINMYTKLLASRLEERAIEVLSVHPGWVKTTLSSTNMQAPLSVEDSVNGIVSLLENNKQTGTFWDAQTQEELNW